MARAARLQEQDRPPEADKLENFLHPRETENLFGNNEAVGELARAIDEGAMHHAWLLAGPEGIGKATLAYRAAKYILSEVSDRERSSGRLDVTASSQAARSVAGHAHANLLVIRREWDFKTKRFSAQIRVDDVRRLRSFLAHKGGEGQWRVIIVDQADELNTAAANALLKSLEEPPPETVFLLISSEPGRLLNTIRSRCRRLDMTALSDSHLKAAVDQAIANTDDTNTLSTLDYETLSAVSGGRVRRVLELAAAGGSDIQADITSLLQGLPKLNWPKIHTLADKLSGASAAAEFELFSSLLLEQIARLVRAKATGEGQPDDVSLANRVIGDGQLASWATLWETVSNETAEAKALNLDKKTLILTTFSRLETAMT